MADAGFPGQHTTTTTVTSNTTVRTDVRFDSSYIRTFPGILKILISILNLLGFISIEVSGFSSHTRGSFFIFVSMVAFWWTAFLLLFYLFHLIEKWYRIPWLKMELVFDAVWVIMYLIASCLTATTYVEAFNVAAFFGFCAMIAYGGEAYMKLRAVQTGQLAQGERVITKQTTTNISPAY